MTYYHIKSLYQVKQTAAANELVTKLLETPQHSRVYAAILSGLTRVGDVEMLSKVIAHMSQVKAAPDDALARSLFKNLTFAFQWDAITELVLM